MNFEECASSVESLHESKVIVWEVPHWNLNRASFLECPLLQCWRLPSGKLRKPIHSESLQSLWFYSTSDEGAVRKTLYEVKWHNTKRISSKTPLQRRFVHRRRPGNPFYRFFSTSLHPSLCFWAIWRKRNNNFRLSGFAMMLYPACFS